MKRPRTPEELASKPLKAKYTFNLNTSNMSYLKERAAKAGTPISSVIDEAVAMYIDVIRRNKDLPPR